jgi:ketol-acid reductoisomerase
MTKIETKHIGSTHSENNNIDNQELIKINDIIRNHPVEIIGKELRSSMTAMKKIL